METALYFPYVRVPRKPWFTQVLLYWDQAATIAPRDLREEGTAFDPYTLELERERLLTFVEPDDDLWKNERNFSSGFLQVVLPTLSVPGRERRRYTRLHAGKVPGSLFHELPDNLANRLEGPEEAAWWAVETTVADAYMAYLAAVLSGASTDGMLPVTEAVAPLATLSAPSLNPGDGRDEFQSRLARLRYAVIQQALPMPGAAIPAAELRLFKEANGDKLRRCRVHLDAKLADLALLDHAELREVKANEVLQELSDDVAVLTERMEKRGWVKVALVGIGGVMAAGLASAATIVTGGAPLLVGLSVGAGVFQMGAAGYGTAELLRSPRYDSRAPLAYAALAGRL